MEPELTGALAGASFFPGDLQCAPRAIARALAGGLPRVHTGVEVHGVAVAARPGDGAAHERRRAGVRRGRHRRRAVEPRAGRGGGRRAAARAAQGPARAPGRAPRDERFIRHKVVEAGYLGSVASADAGLQVTTVLETTWDGDVLVGSSRERRGFDLVRRRRRQRRDARAAPSRSCPACAALRARRRLGRAAAVAARSPAGDRAVAAPSAGLWLATGHEGAGVALGPVTGRLVAQLYAGEAPVVDPAPFSPDRF